MKTTFIFSLIVLLSISTYAQTIISDGTNISGTFTTEDSPYIIEGKAFVQENDELIIEAGTELRFKASNASTTKS